MTDLYSLESLVSKISV